MKCFKKSIKVVMICMLICMQISTISYATGENDSEVKQLKIIVEKCSIVIKVSEDESVHYNYDKEKYGFEINENGNGKEIKITKVKDVLLEWSDYFELYIPKSEYELIVLDNQSGGISITGFDVDLNINVINGALSIKLPDDFSNTLKLTGEKSSIGIEIGENKDFNLNAKINSCAFVVPTEWGRYTNGTQYEYSKGKKKTEIKLNINKSAVIIK